MKNIIGLIFGNKIGINNIEAYVPAYFVDQEKLDIYRRRQSLRTCKGLGQRYMAIPSSNEDAVTMAFNASIKILNQDYISPKEIGLLIVGSESGVDYAKSISAYLHGLLKLPSDVKNFEVKYACLGGAIALDQAFNWIKSGQNRGKSALVVCSDVAKYRCGSNAEPTQGAGAVAMLISKNPSLVTLDKHIGIYSEDVMDFWHPNNSLYAEVKGKYSMNCYSKAIKEAYKDYKKNGGRTDFDRLVFHTPFTKLPKKIGAEIIKTIRQEKGEELLNDESEKDEIEKLVEEKVGPSLEYSGLVGNIYTGSGFLALLNLLKNKNCKGNSVGIGFYGSGCGSLFTRLRIIKAYDSGFKKDLENRIELKPEEYDKVVYGNEKLNMPKQKGCVLKKIDEQGYRYYEILGS